jgi:iron complex transport system ATP-binding protein
MIAKALAQQTPIIYLDEPTAFLDYPSKVDMLMLLSRVSREARKTVFLSTHDLELALQVADMVWLMTSDEGLKIGTPHELAASGDLGRFVERSKDITFDAQTLSVRVKTH